MHAIRSLHIALDHIRVIKTSKPQNHQNKFIILLHHVVLSALDLEVSLLTEMSGYCIYKVKVQIAQISILSNILLRYL
jgi:hypothetical protein